MIIESTPSEVIFRFPRSMKLDELQDFADYFEYLEIAGHSTASQKDVDILVKEIKKGRWLRTKQQFNS